MDRSEKVAKKLRSWQAEHPILDIGLSFVPVVGQAYGAASAGAALRDPEASAFEKGMGALSLLPGGALAKAGKLRKIVIGPKTAKGSPALEGSLASAKDLANQLGREASGASVSKGPKGMKALVGGDPRINDRLHRETGWWIDPDTGRWMHELDDSRAIPDYEFMDQAAANKMLTDQKTISLGDALPHPELEKLPEGRRFLSEVDVAHEPHLGRGGQYSPSLDRVSIGRTPEPNVQSMKDNRELLLHEAQHGVAAREGFEAGNDPAVVGWENYVADPGELLARATALRRNMTPEARRKFPFHRNMEEMRMRQMDPLYKGKLETNEELRRALGLRNLDPDEMLVPGP